MVEPDGSIRTVDYTGSISFILYSCIVIRFVILFSCDKPDVSHSFKCISVSFLDYTADPVHGFNAV